MQLSRVLSGATKTVLAQGVSLLVALAAIPVLLSELGPSEFGALSLCVSALAATNFANLGLGPVVARGVSKALSVEDLAGARRSIATTSLLLAAPAGLVGVALHLGGTWIASVFTTDVETLGSFEAMLSELALAVPAALMALHVRFILEGCGGFGRAAIVRTTTNVSYYLLPVFSVLIGAGPSLGLEMIAWLLLGTTLVSLLSVRKSLGGLFESFGIEELWTRLREAVGFSAFSASQLALFYVDRYMIGALAGLASAGVYVAVSDIATRINLIYGTFTQPLLPAFSSWLVGRREDELARTAVLFSVSVQRLLIAATAGALLLSAPFFRIWLGEELHESAAMLFPWVLYAFATAGLGSVLQRLLLAHQADLRLASIYVALSLAFVPLLFVAVRNHGVQGAGMAVAARGLLELFLLTRIGAAVAPSSAQGALAYLSWSGALGLTLVHGVAVIARRVDHPFVGGVAAVSIAILFLITAHHFGPRGMPGWRDMREAFVRRRSV